MKGFYNRMAKPKSNGGIGYEWGSSFIKKVSHKKVRQKLKVNILDAIDEVQDEHYDNFNNTDCELCPYYDSCDYT